MKNGGGNLCILELVPVSYSGYILPTVIFCVVKIVHVARPCTSALVAAMGCYVHLLSQPVKDIPGLKEK